MYLWYAWSGDQLGQFVINDILEKSGLGVILWRAYLLIWRFPKIYICKSPNKIISNLGSPSQAKLFALANPFTILHTGFNPGHFHFQLWKKINGTDCHKLHVPICWILVPLAVTGLGLYYCPKFHTKGIHEPHSDSALEVRANNTDW